MKHNNIVYLLDFKLVAEKQECTGGAGDEEYQGYLKTIQLCQDACKRISSMFIYGLAPRCNMNGCKCYCEKSSKDGKCTMVGNEYNLYAYTVDKKGEKAITIAFFRPRLRSLRNF